MKQLIIVESPSKAKTIQKYLGGDVVVLASKGHICDLPARSLGIDVEDGFKPQYVVSPEKKETIDKLAQAVGKYKSVYLATDPDREGEAIAWHLKDVLGLSACKRVTYTAITQDDVEAGIAAPRDIDMALVHAQEARRALDRLVGYKVSGPLSRACSESRLSAGRVQSPAVRIVVDREQEIRSFVSTTHYGVELTFDRVENVSEGWNAVWLPREGWLDKDNPYVLDKAVADRVAAVRSLDVLAFVEKEAATAPPAPFTTSSLQQAAGNALKFTPKKTMELAQKLYEAGYITSLRTDSPNLSETVVKYIQPAPSGITSADRSPERTNRLSVLTETFPNASDMRQVRKSSLSSKSSRVTSSGAAFSSASPPPQPARKDAAPSSSVRLKSTQTDFFILLSLSIYALTVNPVIYTVLASWLPASISKKKSVYSSLPYVSRLNPPTNTSTSFSPGFSVPP